MSLDQIPPAPTRTDLDRLQFPDPACRYCGADCSGSRVHDGEDLYACPLCDQSRTEFGTPRGFRLVEREGRIKQEGKVIFSIRYVLPDHGGVLDFGFAIIRPDQAAEFAAHFGTSLRNVT